MSAMEQKAITIATRAHQGQTDKTGHPYIEHPARVAKNVTHHASAADLETARTVAWLHDVIEDTHMALKELATMFPPEVVTSIDAITKRHNENPDSYYTRIRSNRIALAVKHADIDDNTDPIRVARLDEKTRKRLAVKYARARASLSGEL
ncbi:HD domain-containing protein [Arthrobacter castelli]|uniref:HD domain-containing protein n=1 Tax=Arthrobacter castelli TaxID=271431 RepID=UPI000405F463|nr:HD domain-containing protein [Arthrobacter castelli]